MFHKNANLVAVYYFQQLSISASFHTHKAKITPKLDSRVISNKILDVLENRTFISKV